MIKFQYDQNISREFTEDISYTFQRTGKKKVEENGIIR